MVSGLQFSRSIGIREYCLFSTFWPSSTQNTKVSDGLHYCELLFLLLFDLRFCCTCGNKINSLGLIYGYLGNGNISKFAVNGTLSRSLPIG